MTLTVRSATVDGATTKGSALTHAEMDANWAHVIQSSNQSFVPSGTGPTTRTVADALNALVRSGDYASSTNYNSRRDLLTETIGVHKFEIGAGTVESANTPIYVYSADSLASGFGMTHSDFLGNGDRNNVWRWGYNPTQATTEDTGAWWYQTESRYNDGVKAQMEHHLEGVHPHNGATFRVFTWAINRATGYTGHRIDFDDYSWVTKTGQAVIMSIVGATTSAATITFSSITTVAMQTVTVAGNISVTGSVLTGSVDSGAASGVSIKTNNGTQQLLITHTASAAQYVQITGAVSGQPVISVQGTNTDVTMGLSAKGAGGFDFYTEGSTFSKQVQIVHTAGATRTLTLTGSNGGNPTIATSAGNLAITPAVVVAATTGSAIGTTTSSTTVLNLPAGSTAASSIRLAHGAAPTSPVNGDMWTTTAGLFVRVNGATVGPLT